MTVIVPIRAIPLAAIVLALSLSIEARAQDASPWQTSRSLAARLIAGSRSGAVLLGGIAIQLQPGWKTYWRTPGDSGVPPRFDFTNRTITKPSTNPVAGADQVRRWRRRPLAGLSQPGRAAVADCREKCRQAGDASRRDQLRGMREALHPRRSQCRTRLHQRGQHRRTARCSQRSTPCRKPASVGDPNPLTIRDVKRDGKSTVLVDVVSPDAKEVGLFVEGPTPDWGLAVSKTARTRPARRQTLAFELDGVPARHQSRRRRG